MRDGPRNLHDTTYRTMRVNIGCGQTPTPGWTNFDNSLTVRLANLPLLGWIVELLNILDAAQHRFVKVVRDGHLRYADATRRIPLPTHSVDVLYTSHMLEHLDRIEVARFLEEACRVLRPGGILRIAVPDITRLVDQYLTSRDADAFVEATLLATDKPRTFIQRAQSLIIGPRHHHWMYDGRSLCKLLARHAFSEVQVVPAGITRIEDPADLDLFERCSESVYVEAVNR